MVKLRKQVLFVLGILFVISAVSVIPSRAVVYSGANTVVAGDQIKWRVSDCNESNNIYEPTEWTTEYYTHKGNYLLYIGDIITFTVTDPMACSGSLKIGNLTVATGRHELGVNLLVVTGPAWPPYSNYSFDPALISPTTWQTQIELANNATNERVGASLITGTSWKTFLGLNRSVISFNFTWGDQTTETIYDNETGVLLYLKCQFQLWWLEMVITVPSEIPSFEIPMTLILMAGLLLFVYGKKRSRKLSHFESIK